MGLEPTFPHYGCGVLASERPVPSCSMGSEGLEPSLARVRPECAAANTLIPCCLLSRRSARRESNPRLALIRSLLSPLSYEPFVSEPNVPVRPEGIEPSPARLKVCCAAFTPRPRNRSEAGVSMVVSSFRISFASAEWPEVQPNPGTAAHSGARRRIRATCFQPAELNEKARCPCDTGLWEC